MARSSIPRKPSNPTLSTACPPPDRDKYMAFMKIVTDRKSKHGQVQNPFGFTT
jgi:hypothetical protein